MQPGLAPKRLGIDVAHFFVLRRNGLSSLCDKRAYVDCAPFIFFAARAVSDVSCCAELQRNATGASAQTARNRRGALFCFTAKWFVESPRQAGIR